NYNYRDVNNTAISLEALQEWFEKIPAQTLVLILDCCFSGGMGAKVLKVDLQPKIAKSTNTLLDQLSGNGRIILTASGPGEPAWESQKTGHGLLTHFLIQALQGAEEVRSAGKISIFKLLEYVSKRVIDAADSYGHPQNPALRGTLDTNITWPIFQCGDLFRKYFPDHSNAIATSELQSLEAFGFPSEAINGWASSIPALNELQFTAINQFKILAGQHVVVSAPTSSGKTMVGELASLKCVLEGKKALFLLPLKALVNDKLRQFTDIYSLLGIKTIEATGESDDISPLLKGQYDICLLTYEKFLSVILGNPHVLEQVGTVVVDEVQMIADKSRGANLEFLLTLLRMRRAEGIEP
ncbi:MAG: DEAD/DEAH box helicase, partial [Candidatus Cloacimonetes bacterium]|nr:DEAD/DEAH box helicase [Candidatus Cloacimonadota bacterium]